MAKHRKPREGSTGYWHRKRARRIYPRMNVVPQVKEAVPLVFAGYKAGMTSVSYVNQRKGSHTEGQEMMKAATVLDCPPLAVCGVRLYDSSAYGIRAIGQALADKLPKELGRAMSVPEKGSFAKSFDRLEKAVSEKSVVRLIVSTNPKESGFGKKTPEVFEVEIGGGAKSALEYAKSKVGGELKVSDVFKQGQMVDARAVTTGQGYTGPVRRYGIKVRSRKNKHKRRHVGNLGPQNPPKVIPGGKVPEAGQMGFHNRTEYNKKILRISGGGITPRGGFVSYGAVGGDYVIIEGSLPGPKKRLIMLRPAVRKSGWSDAPVEVKYVSLEPQN
jgi:large subunit ribosomal protein L3